MSRLVRIALCAVLALGVCLLTSPVIRGDEEEEQEKRDKADAGKATEGLKKLIDLIEKDKDKKDIAQAAGDLDKTFNPPDLKHIMWAAYKPREKGGLGVGNKGDNIKPDGIEAKLINMSKKEMSEAQLKKEGPALVKMAETAKAMAEIAELNTQRYVGPKKPIADWKKFNKTQKDAAADLIDAVNNNKPDKVLDATKNLYSSCTNCHSVFRD
jgi:hypothetical protein